MSVELGRPLEEFVETLVESGRYSSRREVLREGVRLIQEREARASAINLFLAEAHDDADAAQTRPMDDVFVDLLTELASLREPKREG